LYDGKLPLLLVMLIKSGGKVTQSESPIHYFFINLTDHETLQITGVIL